jgi:multiple sugar transport system permease protein
VVRSPTVLAVALIAPALALRLLTGFWPFLDTAWISLQRSSPLEGPDAWVGFNNYSLILSDPTAQATVFFTVLYTVVSTIAELIVGMLIALLLNQRFRLSYVARTINLVPWAIPVVVAGIAFRLGLDGQDGLLADVIARPTGLRVDWLIETIPARLSVIGANVWRNAPFSALLLLAALQTIPEHLYEAARIDGANRWRIFREITLPLAAPVIISIGVFLLIWQIATFDLILSMTGGGPGSATDVLGYEAYLKAFQGLNFGVSAALSMILFGFVAILGLLGMGALRQVEASL